MSDPAGRRGASDETLLRRWQVKWKANHTVYLAAARDRAESLRRAAEAPSWVQTFRQWDEAIKALQDSPTLRQWNELLRGLQNSPAWEGIDGYKPLRLPVGGIRA